MGFNLSHVLCTNLDRADAQCRLSNPQLNAYVVCQVRDKLSFYSSVLNYIVFRSRLRDRLQQLRESEAANRGEDGSGAQH